MVIDLYLLVLGHTKYKGIDLSTKYKVTVPSTKYFLHSYMYLVLGGKYKVQSTWPKVLGPSSITKVTVKYLVTQLQLLYLTQLWLSCKAANAVIWKKVASYLAPFRMLIYVLS